MIQGFRDHIFTNICLYMALFFIIDMILHYFLIGDGLSGSMMRDMLKYVHDLINN